MSKVKRRCGTCKWLNVPADSINRVIPRKDFVYLCTVEVPPPVLPDSVVVEPYRLIPRRMSPDRGETCPLWQSRKESSS